MSETEFSTDVGGRLRGMSTFPEAPPVETEGTDGTQDTSGGTEAEGQDQAPAGEESEESGGSRTDASTAGEEGEDQDDGGEEAGEKSSEEGAAAKGADGEEHLPKWAKDADMPERFRAKIAKMERDRRGEQSKAAQAENKHLESESDLAVAIERLSQAIADPSAGDGADRNGSGDPVTLESLGLNKDDFVDPEGMEKVFQAINAKQGQANRQSRVTAVEGQIRESLKGKNDIDEVHSFSSKRSLGDHPDAGLLTGLGQYYLGRSLMLEEQIENAEKAHKAELAKAKKGAGERQERLASQPGQPGGRKKDAVRSTGNEVLDLVNRRAARLGQRPDGTWQRPGG